jgi:hypothetical protein
MIMDRKSIIVKNLFWKTISEIEWSRVIEVGIAWSSPTYDRTYSTVYITTRELTEEERHNITSKIKTFEEIITMKRTRKLLKALDDVYGGEIKNRDYRGIGDLKE